MLTAWRNAVQMTPDVWTHRKIADYYESENDYTQMNYHIAKILFIEGREMFHESELLKASDLFRKSVSLDPNDQHAWFYHAETMRLTGNKANAKTAYEQCLKLNPYYGRALIQLDRMKK